MDADHLPVVPRDGRGNGERGLFFRARPGVTSSDPIMYVDGLCYSLVGRPRRPSLRHLAPVRFTTNVVYVCSLGHTWDIIIV